MFHKVLSQLATKYYSKNHKPDISVGAREMHGGNKNNDEIQVILSSIDKRYRRLFESLGDRFVVFSYTVDTNEVTFLSSGFEKVFGIPTNKVIDKHWAAVVKWSPGMKEYAETQQAFLLTGKLNFHKVEMSFIHADGKKRTVEISEYIALDEDGEQVIEGIIEDISEHKELEEKLENLAKYDSLTGLYNRRTIQEKLTKEIQRSARYGHLLSVMLLDLDLFKKINDKYGHQTGDTVLEFFSTLLYDTIRTNDSVGRYGGEEFLILLPETSQEKALEIAERLNRKITDLHIETKGNSIGITASIGIATYPVHGASWEKLYASLDKALYDSKKSGRNCIKLAIK